MLSAIDSSVNLAGEGERDAVLRAAAVQLTATPDKARNLEAADRLVRARRGRWRARSSCCRRSGPSSATARTCAPAPSRSTARRDVGARLARELGIDLVAGSIVRARRGRGEAAQHLAARRPRRRGRRRSTARCTCSTSRSTGTVYRESEHEEPGDEIVLSATADGVELGLTVCYDLRFPELYRILAVRGARDRRPSRRPSRCPRRATTGRCSCAPARSRTSASSSPPTRSASTPPGLRSGGRSMIVDPWGVVLAQAAGRRDRASPPTSTSTRQDAIRRAPAVARQPPPRGLPLARRRPDGRRRTRRSRPPTSGA